MAPADFAHILSPNVTNVMPSDLAHIIPDGYSTVTIKEVGLNLPAKSYSFTEGGKPVKVPYAAGITMIGEKTYNLTAAIQPVIEGPNVTVDWNRPANHFWDTISTDRMTVKDYINYHGNKANKSLISTLNTEYANISELKQTKGYEEYSKSWRRYKRGLLELIVKDNSIGYDRPY
jgi:hypothetical protein